MNTPLAKNKERIYFYLFAALLLLQRGIFSIKYQPIIDDWFLYMGDSIESISNQAAQGKFGLRPVAGFIDCFIIQPLSGNLWVFSVITLFMLFYSLLFLHKTFSENGICSGSFLFLFVALFPLGAEATFWMAASSRIVTALFTASLSSYFLTKLLNTKKLILLVPISIFSFLTFGLYEIAIIFLLALFLIILVINYKIVLENKLVFLYFLIAVFAGLAAVMVVYKLNSGLSDIATRGQMVKGNYINHFIEVTEAVYNVYVKELYKIIKNSTISGFRLIFTGINVIYGILCIAFSVVFSYFSAKTHEKNASFMKSFIAGIILFIAGIALNYGIDFIRISFRVVFFSFIGIGLIADAIMSKIFTNKIIYGIILGVVTFIFLISGIGEFNSYIKAGESDVKIAKELMNSEKIDLILSKDNITVLFGAKTYYDSSTSYFEHIKTIHENYAQVTGAIRFFAKDCDMNNIMPVDENGKIKLLYVDDEKIYCYLALENDFTISSVILKKVEDGYEILRQNNSIYGQLIVDDWGEKLFSLKIN